MKIALVLLAGATACAHAPSNAPSNALDLGPMPPGVTMDAQVQYYDVTAASLAELRRGMLVLGPRWEGRSFSAVTQTHFLATWQLARGDSLCALQRVRVQLRTTVTFPRWNPTAEPDSAVHEWWRQLNAGLMEHERGHALISVRTASDLARDLDGMTRPRCDPLSALADTTKARRIRENQSKQQDYDRATRHGATQIEQAGRLRSP